LASRDAVVTVIFAVDISAAEISSSVPSTSVGNATTSTEDSSTTDLVGGSGVTRVSAEFADVTTFGGEVRGTSSPVASRVEVETKLTNGAGARFLIRVPVSEGARERSTTEKNVATLPEGSSGFRTAVPLPAASLAVVTSEPASSEELGGNDGVFGVGSDGGEVTGFTVRASLTALDVSVLPSNTRCLHEGVAVTSGGREDSVFSESPCDLARSSDGRTGLEGDELDGVIVLGYSSVAGDDEETLSGIENVGERGSRQVQGKNILSALVRSLNHD
jgi:hypothetical protein